MSTSISATEIGLPDNVKLKLGTGDDLEIYHDTLSYIKNNTSKLVIRSDTFQFGTADGAHRYIDIPDDEQGVHLYYDDVKRIETTSSGISVTGNVVASGHVMLADNLMIRLGTGYDFELRHTGSHNYINTSNGNIELRHTVGGANEAMLKAIPNGAVELYHNSIKTLDTTTTGIRIHGDEGGTAQLQLLADQGDDDGDYWRFVAETNGILNIQDYGAGSWYNNIRLTGNTGGVDLFHNNTIRLSTSTSGISIQNGNLALNRQDSSNEGGEVVFNRASDNANQWFNDVYGNDSTAKIRWHHGGAEKFAVKTSGHVAISNGNLELASGMGIDYSLVSDGSRSVSSNLLDDYEEGSWTPSLTGTTSNIGTTSGRSFTYKKIGRVVFFNFDFFQENNNMSVTSGLVIDGLPFDSSLLPSNFLSNISVVSLGLSGASTVVSNYISNSATIHILTSFSSSRHFSGQGFYFTA